MPIKYHEPMTDAELIEEVLAEASPIIMRDPDVNDSTRRAVLEGTRRLMEYVLFEETDELTHEDTRRISNMLDMYVSFYALDHGGSGGSSQDYALSPIRHTLVARKLVPIELAYDIEVLYNEVYDTIEEYGLYPDEFQATLAEVFEL